jgi:peptidoglycan hydrolase-like protein with peptidoglycan-binding domain
MDNLVYTTFWLAYDHPSHLETVTPGGKVRLLMRCWAALAAGLVVSTGFISPVRANWGDVVFVNTPPGYALNTRWGPGTSFGVYQKVRRGSRLHLTGVRRNGWLQLTNGTWVAGNLVSSRPLAGAGGGSDAFPDRNLAYVVTPQGYALNIRRGPGVNYARVGQFANGTLVALSGSYSAGWAQLTDGNWVDNQFLRASYPDNARPPTPQPTFNPYVADLQRRLVQLGYLPSNFVVNGIYDPITQQAVREFQRVNGLPATGIVDQATWRALYDATSNFPNPTPTFTPNPTPTFTPTPTPTISPTQPPSGGQQARIVTDGEDALVFASPDPSSDILRTLANGATVTMTGNVTGNWTELAEGGWVFSLFLERI